MEHVQPDIRHSVYAATKCITIPSQTKEMMNKPLISEAVECAPGILSLSIKILIKDIHANMTLDVESNYTIEQVKHVINDKKDIPIAQQNIIYKGKLLQNQLDLSYYDIINDSVLYLLTTGDPHPIDSDTFEKKKQSTVYKTPLANILEDHGLYDALYSKLNENQIDLESLQNDLHKDEINSFCDELNLNITQKVQFRRLMRTLNKRKNPDSKMTVVLIGDCDAGKTCLIQKYVDNAYDASSKPTIGGEKSMKTETLSDGSNMRITIWDTAGQEKFQSVCASYYRKADCIIICYDSSKETTVDGCEYWRQQIDNYAKDNAVVLLVGCKNDKANTTLHEVNTVKAQSIIEQPQWEKFSTIYYECSAKTGHNVRNVFVAAAELVLLITPEIDQNPNHVNIDQIQSKEESNGCCLGK